MRVSVWSLVAVLAAPMAHGAQRAAAANPAPHSRSDAEALDRKFEDLNERHKAGRVARGKSVLVTESELNSYLNLSLGEQMPRGFSDVVVRLETERIHTTGVLDLEKVRDKMPNLSPMNPLYWLSGQVPVLLRGRVLNHDGFASIDWEDVRVGNVPVPISLLYQVVSSTTRSGDYPDGFDIRAPFPLPYSVRQVRIQPGRAYLDF
ncbi:MAG TPA: hypothetical protein VMT87_10550 [Vicinamibacteria bacterium]|nr:hypothetical protein [Vicinamibacteria bacterium]